MTEPLINDGIEIPAMRTFLSVKAQKEQGKPVFGIYCCYAPLELFWAMNGVVAGLCGTSQKPISDAEAHLPTNLCPMVKASYGFVITDTCPYYKMADVIVCETTCDGKKKIFELIKDKKPTHIMELPISQNNELALNHWIKEVNMLKKWLENKFNIIITDENLENSIKEANHRRELILEAYEYAKYQPTYITNNEITELFGYAFYEVGEKAEIFLNNALEKLEKRKKDRCFMASNDSPRILMAGCPIAGDSEKVYKIIEEANASIVVSEACSGIKPILGKIEENTGDPLKAIAERYFNIPCSIMYLNKRRLDQLDYLIKEFKPDVVIEIILIACHTYNIESHTIEKHVTEKHGLPYLRIETDYSQGDIEQIRTKIEAVLENINPNLKTKMEQKV
ncbi:MAG: double-cubane-cluster-containing anaerobic reductase [Candidatus Hermodarchaeota archaeon]